MSKKRRYGRTKHEKIVDVAVNVVSALIVLFFLMTLYNHFSAEKPDLELKHVSAMRFPADTALQLRTIAEKKKMDFPKLLAIYGVDNRFFPIKETPPSLSELNKTYGNRLNRIHRKYDEKYMAPYVTLIRSVLSDMKQFPVGAGSDYSYVDSFGATSSGSIHDAIDIVDTQNRAGRLTVVSMTDGTVSEAGLNSIDGYFIKVVTKSNNEYTYAHLDSVSSTIKKGHVVKAGDILGTVGNSGSSEFDNSRLVRLHISIRVPFSLTGDKIYINPYIFLRLIENI